MKASAVLALSAVMAAGMLLPLGAAANPLPVATAMPGTPPATSAPPATSTPSASPASSTPAVAFGRRLDGFAVGQHKAPPSSRVTITIEATPDGMAPAATLTDYFPSAWTMVDAAGGLVSAVDGQTSWIAWPVGDLGSGQTASRSYVLASPSLTTPPTEFRFLSALSSSGGIANGDPWMVMVADPPCGTGQQPTCTPTACW